MPGFQVHTRQITSAKWGANNNNKSSPTSPLSPVNTNSTKFTFSIRPTTPLSNNKKHSFTYSAPIATFSTLPNELILAVMEQLPLSDLKTCRLLSRKFQQSTDCILRHRLIGLVNTTKTAFESSEELYTSTQSAVKPSLQHYKSFTRNLSHSELSEATWYTNPSIELQNVCTCLCLLRGHDESEVSDWNAVKKIMGKYDFKNWFVQLEAKNLDAIKLANIKKVEKIIMTDADLTYERLREVSMAGYKLLIIIAACLQYGNLWNDLKMKKQDMLLLKSRLNGYTKLLSAL